MCTKMCCLDTLGPPNIKKKKCLAWLYWWHFGSNTYLITTLEEVVYFSTIWSKTPGLPYMWKIINSLMRVCIIVRNANILYISILVSYYKADLLKDLSMFTQCVQIHYYWIVWTENPTKYIYCVSIPQSFGLYVYFCKHYFVRKYINNSILCLPSKNKKNISLFPLKIPDRETPVAEGWIL